VEIQNEDYQESGSEQSNGKSRHIISVITEGRSSTDKDALMIRPIAGPLQALILAGGIGLLVWERKG